MPDEAIVVSHPQLTKREYKTQWQRITRKSFRESHGYSLSSSYGCGKMRAEILSRDRNRCVSCGMTDEEHRQTWGRPITIDHKDRNRKNNAAENLQTLCLRCHGKKDQIPSLKKSKTSEFKETIILMRKRGVAYQSIANDVGLSIASVWKWFKKWEKETQEWDS